MIFKKKETPYVLFLMKNSCLFLGDGLKEVVSVEFSDDVIVDLEIQNQKSFENTLVSVMEQHKMKPGEVVVLLSSELYYVQDFSNSSQESIQQFLTLIPFEEVISQQSIVGTTVRVSAVSDDLLHPFVQVLSSAGFSILGVCPDIATGKPLETIEQFTSDFVQQILLQQEILLQHSLYSQPKNVETVSSLRHADGKIFSPKLIIMIILFVGLLAILGALILRMNQQNAASNTPAPEVPQPTSAIVPAVTISSESIEATDSAISQEVDVDVDIQVLNGSGVPGQAEVVGDALEEAGFERVSTGNADAVGESTIVLVRASVSAATRAELLEILGELELDPSLQENAELDSADVLITTGSNE